MPDGLTPVGRGVRLLMTADAVGGVWQYATDLAEALVARGATVVLAIMGPARAPLAPPGVRVVDTGLDLDWTAPDPGATGRSTAALARLAREVRATHVHLHAPALVGEADWPAPVVAVAHSCVATWWAAVRGGALPPDLAWRAELTAQGLHRADVAVAPTHAFAAQLRAVYGSLDLRVIHNGRRTQPRLPARERRVLTAGRLWDEGKNVALLDAAAALIDAPVCAAGPVEGACFEHLRLLGTLGEEALAAERARAGVFASVPRYEPFGLAVLEASQAGLPLVLSDIPTLRELWDGAALFVPASHDKRQHAESLAATLSLALDHPADLGARAKIRAAKYTIGVAADATLALHHALA